jgi:hypothetical protein
LADVCAKLRLESVEDTEFIVAKCILDGVIDAFINHEVGAVTSSRPDDDELPFLYQITCLDTVSLASDSDNDFKGQPRRLLNQRTSDAGHFPAHDHVPFALITSTAPFPDIFHHQFHKRVAFCLDMHNQAVKAMRYAENTKTEWESAEEVSKQPLT